MFKTVILAIDDRPQDEEAYALALRLADADAELLVLNVGVLGTSSVPARFVAERAEDVADDFAERHPGVEAAGVTGASVGQAIAEVAVGARADLVVVASSRHGLLGRVFTGDAIRDILHHAPCAVAVAPVGYDERGTLRRVVAGYDGSEEAREAARTGAALARRDGAEAWLLQIVQPADDDEAPAPDVVRPELDRLARELGMRPRVGIGQAARQLAVDAGDADVLCVGFRHRGWLDEVLSGSTAVALSRGPQTPLVIVPPSARNSTTDALDDAQVQQRGA